MAGWVIYGGNRRNPLIPSKPKESRSFWGVPNWRNMKKESSISERNEKDSCRIPFGGVSDWRNGKRNEQPSDPPSERTNGSEHKRGAAAPWFNGAAVLPVNKCGSSWLLCVSLFWYIQDSTCAIFTVHNTPTNLLLLLRHFNQYEECGGSYGMGEVMGDRN